MPCDLNVIFSCHERVLACVSPKNWLIFVGKSRAKLSLYNEAFQISLPRFYGLLGQESPGVSDF